MKQRDASLKAVALPGQSSKHCRLAAAASHRSSCCSTHSLAKGHRQMSQAFSGRQGTRWKPPQISQMKVGSWFCAKKKKENESDETDAGADDDKVSELLPSERQL